MIYLCFFLGGLALLSLALGAGKTEARITRLENKIGRMERENSDD